MNATYKEEGFLKIQDISSYKLLVIAEALFVNKAISQPCPECITAIPKAD